MWCRSFIQSCSIIKNILTVNIAYSLWLQRHQELPSIVTTWHMRTVQVESGIFRDKLWCWLYIMKIQSEKISHFCFRTCCMNLVQKLDILCLHNHERVKTGRRSPFYLNCSHMVYGMKLFESFHYIASVMESTIEFVELWSTKMSITRKICKTFKKFLRISVQEWVAYNLIFLHSVTSRWPWLHYLSIPPNEDHFLGPAALKHTRYTWCYNH